MLTQELNLEPSESPNIPNHVSNSSSMSTKEPFNYNDVSDHVLNAASGSTQELDIEPINLLKQGLNSSPKSTQENNDEPFESLDALVIDEPTERYLFKSFFHIFIIFSRIAHPTQFALFCNQNVHC